jgi:serine/threonine protein kinase
MSADKTERMPSPHGTLIRPAQPAGPDDQSRLRPSTDAPDAAPTQIEGPAKVERTQRVEPSGETRQQDPDATVRTHREMQETAARTLKADASADAYAATLQAAAAGAETQVMHNRPTRTLEAEEGHRGPLEPGAVIKKRFVLETLLGKGGMGLVYGAIDRRKEEARDPNPRVALKVLSADFQRHPQSFIALQREARKAQTLAHPNVVTVFDFDRDGDAVYMTMELLQGRTLDSIVREARGKGVGRDVAMPIIRGIAEGLAYAHRKNIVHSDLKPGNVFITEDGTAKILDFGIARAVPSAVADEHRDVFDAGALGAYTEAYATDEMIDGVDPHPADDMYALGIIAYELMTGLHPYQRHSAPGARKLGMKPAPLKGLKRKQARAIESCLSFDRRQRPQNAGQFLKAFRGVTALQKATLAATVVLTLAAGYLWRENYLETSPSIPFEELSFEQQQQFREYMRQGNEAWTFYEREHLVNALSDDAIGNYARAYDIHPRNRAAVAALNRTADTLLEEAGDSEGKRREIARVLQETSGHFRQYPPVVEAAR